MHDSMVLDLIADYIESKTEYDIITNPVLQDIINILEDRDE